LGASVSRRK
jgi:transposase InsO family protein